MRIVKDERLMIERLKHTRIAFVLQNLAILGIIFYRYVIQGTGYDGISDLLMLFMSGIVIINFLNLKQSVEVYEGTERVKRSYFLKLLLIPIILAIVIMGINMIVTPDASLKDTGLIALVLFLCFLVPSLYAYRYRRTIRAEEDE
ncbi:hypothetical protein [Bacillus bingmayongensis]|uniref:hypothetical protein n=1 Tax=Bacillus bingmayongensis TaxID=1150157 RepID=UPI00030E2475|nr:hypothetical protein [Bacillus bingmayongensis]MBY0595048.1 hypothetical protein [Bacillus bingmayongensis]